MTAGGQKPDAAGGKLPASCSPSPQGASAAGRPAKAQTRNLPSELREAALGVAQRLKEQGHRAWIVGGAVRDLLLGLEPGDVDMASAATPEEVEAVFGWTLPVGKAFGTMLVHWPEEASGVEVQVTTFRSERGYSDARRPDEVAYGRTPEEDALRRDFTCNALFLDPLTDEVLDPTGGVADLVAGRLRCVGEPRERFAEDGLRLLRLARFAAGFGLEPTPEVIEAARAERASLRGVSVERVYAELRSIFKRPGAARALEVLERCELIEVVLPHLATRGADEIATRRRVLDALPQPVGTGAGLAVVFEDDQELVALRAPLAVQREVSGLWAARRELEQLDETATRSQRFLALRDEHFDGALHLALAWRAACGLPSNDLQTLAVERAGLTREDLFPEACIDSSDLAARKVPRGPLWGTILREAELARLDQVFRDREGALRWLTERIERG